MCSRPIPIDIRRFGEITYSHPHRITADWRIIICLAALLLAAGGCFCHFHSSFRPTNERGRERKKRGKNRPAFIIGLNEIFFFDIFMWHYAMRTICTARTRLLFARITITLFCCFANESLSRNYTPVCPMPVHRMNERTNVLLVSIFSPACSLLYFRPFNAFDNDTISWRRRRGRELNDWTHNICGA